MNITSLLQIVQNIKIAHIYGKESVGKTTFALQLALEAALAQKKKKIIFTNVNGKFDPRRLKQISGDFFTFVSKKIIIFNLKTFDEQSELIDYIPLIGKSISMLILDDFTYFLWNKIVIEKADSIPYLLELNRQLAFTKYFADKFGYKVIITNLVTSEEEIPLYYNIINFWSDLDIKISKYQELNEKSTNLRILEIFPSNIRLLVRLTKEGFKIEDSPHGLAE
ncbi:MAG: hypothetical protein ACP6IS_04920 [Candidatus Asgardarchaeia archaeon]